MPKGLLSSLLNFDPWQDSSFDSHAWHKDAFHPGFEVKRHGQTGHWPDYVSFKKKKKGRKDMNKCFCPVLGHCVPGFQCPLGEHIDTSKCFKTVTVKYPPDPAYQACLKEKEEDPRKKCKLKILEDLKVKTGGWFRTGGDDHPIAWKVKGLAKSAGVKRGYELIAIDGNQADWREDGYKAYLKGLNWNVPPSGPVECEPGDGCKTPVQCQLPVPTPQPGSEGRRRFPIAFQEVEAPSTGPCYPNGHSLTFKVSAPAWMFFAGPKTTCRAFRETCCAEASTREKPEFIFAESCSSKEMCKPQQTCEQMPGRPGICKYQVTELKGDYDEMQENEDKQEEAAAQAEQQEQEQERQEEEEEGE